MEVVSREAGESTASVLTNRPHPTLEPARSWWRTWRSRIAWTVVATALVLGGFFLRRGWGPAKLGEKDTVVLTDFENKTQDSVFDDTLRQAFTVKLEQSPFLNILSERKTEQMLRLMGLQVDQPITVKSPGSFASVWEARLRSRAPL